MSEGTEMIAGASPFASIPEAVEDIRAGRVVIVVDDADRENEGDLIMAAEKVTPEAIAFIVRHSSGVICMPVVGERLDELQIPLMVADNTDHPPHSPSRWTPATASPRGSRRRIARPPSGARGAGHRAEDLSSPGTSSRCGTARAGCSSAPATPRPPSTSPGSPASTRPASCARWSTTTARWRGCRTWSPSRAEHGLRSSRSPT